MSVSPSVCLSAWNNSAPTGQILMQFDTWIFSKICWANESLIKIRQKYWVLYMMTFSHLWQYRAKSFLAWEMFQIKVVEEIRTHFLCSITFCRRSCPLWYNVEKFTAATEATATMGSCRRITLALYLHCLSCSLYRASTPALGPTQLARYCERVVKLTTGPLSISEVKNLWSYYSTSSYALMVCTRTTSPYFSVFCYSFNICSITRWLTVKPNKLKEKLWKFLYSKN